MASKPSTWFVAIFFALLLAFSFLCIFKTSMLVDELAHYPQITKFLNKDFSTLSKLTTLPGYHAFMAYIAAASGLSSLPALRGVTTIIAFFSIIAFYLISRRLHPNGFVRTLQYALFPIIFPFFFLIYTDIFSLLIILLAFLCFLEKRTDFAWVLLIASFFVRQNNIVWLPFFAAIVYFTEYGMNFDLQKIKEFSKNNFLFFIGSIIFLMFLLINKGFAIGDIGHHPAFTFHLGNIYFVLFLFFFLFLPLNISNFPYIVRLFSRKKYLILVAIAVFAIYWFTFSNNHQLNLIPFHLRNRILMYFTQTPLLKAVFFIPIIYSIFSIAVTKLKEKTFYLLYPFTFLFLIPSWLIEQRYYIIPITLFMLFREEKSRLVEYSTSILYIAATAYIFYGIITRSFFL